jgi:hypothetical protein
MRLHETSMSISTVHYGRLVSGALVRAGARALGLWHLERASVLAVIALMIVIIGVVGVVLAMLRDGEALQREITSLETSVADPENAAIPQTPEASTPLLPHGTEAAAVLETLALTTKQRGIRVGEVTTTLDRDINAPQIRQTFEFQAQGSFLAIGELVADMLNRHRSLALDSISSQRTTETGQHVNTTLRFSLFLLP